MKPREQDRAPRVHWRLSLLFKYPDFLQSLALNGLSSSCKMESKRDMRTGLGEDVDENSGFSDFSDEQGQGLDRLNESEEDDFDISHDDARKQKGGVSVNCCLKLYRDEALADK